MGNPISEYEQELFEHNYHYQRLQKLIRESMPQVSHKFCEDQNKVSLLKIDFSSLFGVGSRYTEKLRRNNDRVCNFNE